MDCPHGRGCRKGSAEVMNEEGELANSVGEKSPGLKKQDNKPPFHEKEQHCWMQDAMEAAGRTQIVVSDTEF